MIPSIYDQTTKHIQSNTIQVKSKKDLLFDREIFKGFIYRYGESDYVLDKIDELLQIDEPYYILDNDLLFDLNPFTYPYIEIQNPLPTEISFNLRFKNKIKGGDLLSGKYYHPYKFKTVYDIQYLVGNGYSFSSVYDSDSNSRSKESFHYSFHIALDFDGGMSLDEATQNPIIKNESALIYTSASHTEDIHKFRVLFLLPRKVTRAYYKVILDNMKEIFPHADKQCFEEARLFFGNENAIFPLVENRVISERFFDQLTKQNRSIINIEPKTKPSIEFVSNPERTRERVLQCIELIPPKPKDRLREVYCTIVLSLRTEFSEYDVIQMTRGLFVSSNTKPENILKSYKPGFKRDGYGSPLSINSFFYYAKQLGGVAK